MDCLDEGIMLVDQDDRIALWNTAFVDMLDFPAELLQPGAKVEPLIRVLADRGDYGPGDPAALTQQIAASIRERREARGERQMVSGKIVQVEWLVLPERHFLFRLRDVTAERKGSRFKDDLIATVSHELSTPLTAIIGALGLLKASAAGADARITGLVDVARKNSDRLARLVNDLLDMDGLQSGALDFEFRLVDVGALLTAAIEQNLPYSDSLGVTIELETPDDAVIAELDWHRLLQVMSNLLSNAAKFSPTGSTVRVRLRPSAQSARISVIDRGRGMAPEFVRRLFTRFAQENRGTERGQAGTGLGLSICKSIIDRHGGQIHVDTREGVGTIFHVDLPYRQAGST